MLGDSVEWIKSPPNVQRGLYEIVGYLPEIEDGQFRYRIRSDAENADRVAVESQLSSRPRWATTRPRAIFAE
jgi:hypothetical protein